jgi:hypothetical protein
MRESEWEIAMEEEETLKKNYRRKFDSVLYLKLHLLEGFTLPEGKQNMTMPH